MGGDVDSRLGGRSPSLSSVGKPYWRLHHMENGGFFGSCTLQEKESQQISPLSKHLCL